MGRALRVKKKGKDVNWGRGGGCLGRERDDFVVDIK